MATHFYVYVVFRRNGTPCYVGKGQGGRWRQHITNSHNKRLKRIFAKAGADLPIIKIREGLTNQMACETEVALIAAVGRADLGTGPLVNMTDGGEGMTGHIQTKDTRAKKSKALKGRSRPPHIIAAMLAGCGTPQWRERQSASHKGKKPSEAQIANQSQAQLERYGRSLGVGQEVIEALRSIPRTELTISRVASVLGVTGPTAKKWCAKVGIETQTKDERIAAFVDRNIGNKHGLGNKRTPEGHAKVAAGVSAANRLRVATPEYRELRRQIAIRMHAERRARKEAAQPSLPLL